MDIILFIFGLILCLIGITGSFVPMIPGPFVSWLAILILNLTDAVEFNLNFVLITLSVAVAIGLIDYLIPIIGVKKLGGSKSGQVGTFIRLVLAIIIIGPFGILVGPFIGAIIGEMANNKSFSESLKPAFGSLVGIVAGTIIKFCLTFSYLYFYVYIFWENKDNFF
ncbi:MAG: DUF456 domain-containing protein [Bacteroidota bacterium]|nr:DUF456 domain-containing protein [Bacteroidota bacterium]